MIAVNLDGVAPGGWYDDSASLLDYGFEQRAELIASGAPFDGAVASFSDPAVAEIARSTTSSAAYTVVEEEVASSGESVVSADPVVVSAPADEPAAISRIAAPAAWAVAGLAIGLLAIRAVISSRDLNLGFSHRLQRKADPRADRPEIDSVEGNPV